MIGFHHEAVADSNIQDFGIIPKILKAIPIAMIGRIMNNQSVQLISHGRLGFIGFVLYIGSSCTAMHKL
jgi:hypothetical protein